MTVAPFFVEGRLRLDRVVVRTNPELLEAWMTAIATRYRGKTLVSYRQAAERFISFLDARGVYFGSLTQQFLADYLASSALKCRSLGSLNGMHLCRESVFTPAPSLPSACGFVCPSYAAVKIESYIASTEMPLARMFEFAADETTAGITNFFPEVRSRVHASFKKRRVREREDTRYPRRALTNGEIKALFDASSHPRDRLVIAIMLKIGIRHQEALLLPDGPDIRTAWKRDRIITVESSPGVKRLGNPYLVIDDQLWDDFLCPYWVWKDEVTQGAAEKDPRKNWLLLGKNGRKVLKFDGMATLWREAGERARIRIRADSNAPLTPHSARYTFVRFLEEAGFSSFWIARLRGDAQAPDAAIRSAWTYAKRSPEELRTAYLERFPELPL